MDWQETHAQRFRAAMDDDFNTPEAVAELHQLANASFRGDAAAARQLRALGGVLGLLQRDAEAFLQSAPAGALSDAEIRARIDKAIDQLSPEHRAVILMKEIDDMQYHEIAEALGCSIGTVMSRLFYARKKLQNLLRDVYENV